jgi:hypothetical protein
MCNILINIMVVKYLIKPSSSSLSLPCSFIFSLALNGRDIRA